MVERYRFFSYRPMWRANQIFLLINLLQLISHISKTIGQFDKYLDQSTTSLPFVSRRVERGEHLFVFIITRARDDERRRRRFYRCRRIFCFPLLRTNELCLDCLNNSTPAIYPMMTGPKFRAHEERQNSMSLNAGTCPCSERIRGAFRRRVESCRRSLVS